MVDSGQQTSFEKLRQILYRQQGAGGGLEKALTNPNASTEEIRQVALKEATLLEESAPGILKQHEISIDGIRDSIPDFVPQQTTSSTSPSSQGLSPTDFLPKPKEKNPHWSVNPTGKSDKEKANETLRNSQERTTLQEFERLLTNTPTEKLPQAIEQFYHQHLTAVGILGNQYLIVRAKVMGMERFDKDTSNTLEKQKDELLKSRSKKNLDEQQQKEDESATMLRDLVEGITPENRERRIAQARKFIHETFSKEWEDLEGMEGYRSAIEAISPTVRYSEYIETGFDEAAQTVVVTSASEYTPPEAIPQNDQQLQQFQGMSPKGTAGKLVDGARNVKSTAENARKAGNLLTKAGELAGGGGETAGVVAGATTEAALTPEGGIAIIVFIIIIFLLIIFGVVIYMIFAPNVTAPPQPTATQDVLQNAQLISNYLCKTHAADHGVCTNYGNNLYDNFRPYLSDTAPAIQSFPITLPVFKGAKINYYYFPNPDGKTLRYYVRNDPDPNYSWGRFWCTDMVINSYAAAGFQDLLGWSDANFHFPNPDMRFWDTGNVSVMMAFFQTQRQKGYQYISRDQFLPDLITPGSAIFFKWQWWNPFENILGDHTAIVSSVNQQQNLKKIGVQSGTISIIQANAPSKTGTVWYSALKPGGQPILEPDVMGFGLKVSQ